MEITLEELVSIIGSKEVEIIILRRELEATRKRLTELEKKPEAK